MTDWRALCEELVEALDGWHQAVFETGISWVRPDETYLIDRARAALAQPESEVVEPTDEELDELFTEIDQSGEALSWRAFARAVLARWGRPAPVPAEGEGLTDKALFRIASDCRALYIADDVDYDNCSEVVAAMRAAIAADRARYSHQPAPLAPGEVGELVRWLRGANWDSKRQTLATRAADLLEQHYPAPVPVAERLPSASHVYFGFVISDADDCTQAGGIAPTYAQALSEGQHYLAQYQQDGPHTLELRRVEVLPPDALPLLPEDAHVIEPTKHTILVPVPAPVPVAERLPGPGDCDAEGRCWWWRTDDADEWWELLCISDAREYNAGCGNARYTHWLPAHALPLPQGEVEG